MPIVYTSQQKALISQFTSITTADKSAAAKSLKANGWNLTQAVNNYLTTLAPSAVTTAAKNNLTTLFNKFKDGTEVDTMTVDGTMEYLEALDVGVEGIGSFVVQEVVGSPTMGEIKKDGFISGWGPLGCDTIDKQKTFLKNRIATLAQPASRDVLKKTYKHAFRLPLTSTNQKSIDKETAVAMWTIFFSTPSIPWQTESHDWLELWTDFLGQSSVKGVNADVWDQTFKFAEQVLQDETLSWWDEMASWPGIMDDFIEWLRENKGIGKKEQADEMEY